MNPQFRSLLESAAQLGVSLMPARAAQAVTGAASIWAIGRAIDLDGLGDVIASLAAIGIVAGIVGSAFSDYALATPNGLSARLPGSIARMAWGSAVTAVLALVLNFPTYLVVVLFVISSLCAALDGSLRLAHARARTETRRIGWVWSLSSFVSFSVHVCLSIAHVADWDAYLVAYLPTMLAPLFFAKLTAIPSSQRYQLLGYKRACRDLTSYGIAQGSWVIFGQAPIVIGRILLDAEAAAILGVAIRIVDSVGVLLPIMGLMALPIFTRLRRTEPDGVSQWPVNRSVAIVGTVWIAGVGPAGWIMWRILVPTAEFPTLVYGLLMAGSVCGATFGVPDRILQASGRPGAVGRWSSVAAVTTVAWCSIATEAVGIAGAASSVLAAAVVANVGLMASAAGSVNRTITYSGAAVCSTLVALGALIYLPGSYWLTVVWLGSAGGLFVWSVRRFGNASLNP